MTKAFTVCRASSVYRKRLSDVTKELYEGLGTKSIHHPCDTVISPGRHELIISTDQVLKNNTSTKVDLRSIYGRNNNKLIYFFSMEADIPDLEMIIANEFLIA